MLKDFIKLIIIFLISSVYLYSYELRLHFSRSYIDDNILYADAYAGINMEVDENLKRYIEKGIIIFLNFRVDFLKNKFIINENIKVIYFNIRKK